MVTRFKFWFYFKDSLIGRVKLAKNADPDKYKYRGYGIGFDWRSELSLPDRSEIKNVIIFWIDMSLSVHTDNKKRDIFIFALGPTPGLDDTTLAAEAQCSINFSRSNRNFYLSLHYNGRNSLVFANAARMYQYKTRFWKKISLVFREYFRRFFSQ